MTSEERQRMNSLVVGIQEQKDYDRFAHQAREIYDLIERKARRFGHASAASQPLSRARRTMPAIVKQILKPMYHEQPEKVEISIPEADDLFREIRIVNTLMGVDGQLAALKQGARIDVTFEAMVEDTVRKFTDSDT
jgi:hypothetical protein